MNVIHLPETLQAMAEHAHVIGLFDHSVGLARASRRDGTNVALRTFAPCPTGVVLWVLSPDAAETFAELYSAAEAVLHVSTTVEHRTAAEALIRSVEAINLGSAYAAQFVRRAA